MFAGSVSSRNALVISTTGINLPSFHEITTDELDKVLREVERGLCL
jgi:dTDP-4-amino-4,6-dideoxygalactose transaminase